VHIVIKEKDVLRNLLEDAGMEYVNILPEGKSQGKAGMVRDLMRRGKRLIDYVRKVKPDVLVGTSVDISYTGKLLGIPAINVNEDDADVVPMYAWLAYPLATSIVSPESCNNGRWQKKTISYKGYHELAYLHPDHFTPSREIVSRYTNPEEDYFIVRFSGLDAHHDSGVKGIDSHTAIQMVDLLGKHGKVFITSERELISELENFRMAINPSDIHHMIAFSKLLIADSQTMSAEAAVLGTPYIRYNDFVGRIGYLKELENEYQLGFGIKPGNPKMLFDTVKGLLNQENLGDIYQERRQRMLSKTINVADFLYEIILEVVGDGRV